MQIQENGLKELLLDTIRVGGGLVFLTSESAPEWCTQYLEVFQGLNFGKCPVAVRNFASLSSGQVVGHAKDLICVLGSDVSILAKVGLELQGQRLVFVASEEEAAAFAERYTVDFHTVLPQPLQWSSWIGDVLSQVTPEVQADQYAGTYQAPCLFLDRDDVIIKNVPYNTDPSKVELREGIVQLLRDAHKKGHWVAMVTNQAGLGRQKFNWEDLRVVQQRVLQLLAQEGCWIDECVWAGYISSSEAVAGRRFASLRKPRHGMFQLVQEKLKADLVNSTMVGDSSTDLIAAYYAGVKKCYLVEVEKTAKEVQTLAEFQKKEPSFSYKFIRNLSEVVL